MRSIFFLTLLDLLAAVAFVALDFFAAGRLVVAFAVVDFAVVAFGVVDFESTVLGSVTNFSRLASFVVFFTADFTVLGAVFW